ncbi:hypothetical protein I5G58_gp102 [Mycobacterium phage BirdsNest]|uniref:Uncharacterized protein n=1 Tax=Mycobacterium phage BirdsNest TaxID=2686231 RepID=A0A6B9LHU1_9CAUD|nr:hypothetical protein I5G58_gp102 [Mycobacterium phage BirdsNest]QHB37404.1 hypothetical protein PBI_BIRDSNEST_102 [Mycobacterium phage BirdsNest]
MSATLTLPRLTARNAAEARVQLAERKAILLQAAEDMAERASLFAGEPIQAELIAQGWEYLRQARLCG